MREAGVAIQKVKTKKMAESTCKQRIVLDMSYDDLMSDKVVLRLIFFWYFKISITVLYFAIGFM